MSDPPEQTMSDDDDDDAEFQRFEWTIPPGKAGLQFSSHASTARGPHGGFLLRQVATTSPLHGQLEAGDEVIQINFQHVKDMVSTHQVVDYVKSKADEARTIVVLRRKRTTTTKKGTTPPKEESSSQHIFSVEVPPGHKAGLSFSLQPNQMRGPAGGFVVSKLAEDSILRTNKGVETGDELISIQIVMEKAILQKCSDMDSPKEAANLIKNHLDQTRILTFAKHHRHSDGAEDGEGNITVDTQQPQQQQSSALPNEVPQPQSPSQESSPQRCSCSTFECQVPPGKAGLSFHLDKRGPSGDGFVVSKVSETGPLVGRVQVGDILLNVDGMDTSKMDSAKQVTDYMKEHMDAEVRVLTFVRRSEDLKNENIKDDGAVARSSSPQEISFTATPENTTLPRPPPPAQPVEDPPSDPSSTMAAAAAAAAAESSSTKQATAPPSSLHPEPTAPPAEPQESSLASSTTSTTSPTSHPEEYATAAVSVERIQYERLQVHFSPKGQVPPLVLQPSSAFQGSSILTIQAPIPHSLFGVLESGDELVSISQDLALVVPDDDNFQSIQNQLQELSTDAHSRTMVILRKKVEL